MISRLLAAISSLVSLVAAATAHPSRSAVALDGGSVIVPDAVHSVIWRFTADGRVEPFARDTHTHWAVAGPDGTIYAEHLTYDPADKSFTQSLLRFDADGGGGVSIAPPVTGPAQFGAFVVQPGGTVLYAPESSPGRIFALSPGALASVWLASGESNLAFAGISAIALRSDGAVVFTDGQRLFVAREPHMPQLLTRQALTTPIQITDAGPANAGEIWGIAVDQNSTVYFAAPHERCVIAIAMDGTSTVALTSTSPWFPTGLACRAGRLFVVEHGLEGDRNLGPRLRVRNSDGRVESWGTLEQ